MTIPEAFAILTQTPVPFLYRSKDAELYAERPLIQLSCRGEVSAVHYNSRSIAPLRLAARDAQPVLLALIGASPRCCATRGFICGAGCATAISWCSTINAPCTAARRFHRASIRATCAAAT